MPIWYTGLACREIDDDKNGIRCVKMRIVVGVKRQEQTRDATTSRVLLLTVGIPAWMASDFMIRFWFSLLPCLDLDAVE